jgi:hypothetical protein
MSAVTNREHTHEAHSNIPMLASSPDVLPPDPYPFLAEAPAADPRLISSLGEEPLPLPPMPRAAWFWSKPPRATHSTQKFSFHSRPITGRLDRLCTGPCDVPAVLRQARGNNSRGRCWAVRSTGRPSLRRRSWGRRNRCRTFCPRVETRLTFLHGNKIRIETTWLDKP